MFSRAFKLGLGSCQGWSWAVSSSILDRSRIFRQLRASFVGRVQFFTWPCLWTTQQTWDWIPGSDLAKKNIPVCSAVVLPLLLLAGEKSMALLKPLPLLKPQSIISWMLRLKIVNVNINFGGFCLHLNSDPLGSMQSQSVQSTENSRWLNYSTLNLF